MVAGHETTALRPKPNRDDKHEFYVTHANDVLSLDRYGQAASPAFLAIFVRTLEIAVTGTVLCLLIAFPMAYAFPT